MELSKSTGNCPDRQNEFEIQKVLGKGSFGQVFSLPDTNPQMPYKRFLAKDSSAKSFLPDTNPQVP
eukprot:scaffold134022_cov36-Cyclotella_meneghiniana.AAC.3